MDCKTIQNRIERLLPFGAGDFRPDVGRSLQCCSPMARPSPTLRAAAPSDLSGRGLKPEADGE